MTINIDKYKSKNNNRIYRIIQYILKKRIFPLIKKFIIGFLKFILWLIPLCFVPLYYNDYNAKFSFGWVFGLYVYWTFVQYQARKNYKQWQELSQLKPPYVLWSSFEVEFQKRFCKSYNPINYIVFSVLAIFLPINFVPLWLYLLIFFCITVYDTYERRYLTLSIKQDLILEKLNTIH